MIRRIRHNMGIKAIAMAVLCLFLFNQLGVAECYGLAVSAGDEGTYREMLDKMQRRDGDKLGGDEDLAQPGFEGEEGTTAQTPAQVKNVKKLLEELGIPRRKIGQNSPLRSSDFEQLIRPRWERLTTELKIPPDAIRQYPVLLTYDFETKILPRWRDLTGTAEGQLAIPEDEIRECPALLALDFDGNILPKWHGFTGTGSGQLGFPEDAVRQNPKLLLHDFEGNIQPKYYYLTKIGLVETRVIQRNTAFLTSSLDDKIRPRVLFLLLHGKKLISRMCYESDSAFIERLKTLGLSKADYDEFLKGYNETERLLGDIQKGIAHKIPKGDRQAHSNLKIAMQWLRIYSDELRLARARGLVARQEELSQFISHQANLAIATLPHESGERALLESTLAQIARYETQEDISIDKFIKRHAQRGNIYTITGDIRLDSRFAQTQRDSRDALIKAIQNSILQGKQDILARLEAIGCQIQLLVVGDKEPIPRFEGKEVRGHASDRYITVIIRENELQDTNFILGKIFHEIRARSHKPEQELAQFDTVNERIEAQVRQHGHIQDPELQQEFASLTFPKHLDFMYRDYTAQDGMVDNTARLTQELGIPPSEIEENPELRTVDFDGVILLRWEGLTGTPSQGGLGIPEETVRKNARLLLYDFEGNILPNWRMLTGRSAACLGIPADKIRQFPQLLTFNFERTLLPRWQGLTRMPSQGGLGMPRDKIRQFPTILYEDFDTVIRPRWQKLTGLEGDGLGIAEEKVRQTPRLLIYDFETKILPTWQKLTGSGEGELVIPANKVRQNAQLLVLDFATYILPRWQKLTDAEKGGLGIPESKIRQNPGILGCDFENNILVKWHKLTGVSAGQLALPEDTVRKCPTLLHLDFEGNISPKYYYLRHESSVSADSINNSPVILLLSFNNRIRPRTIFLELHGIEILPEAIREPDAAFLERLNRFGLTKADYDEFLESYREREALISGIEKRIAAKIPKKDATSRHNLKIAMQWLRIYSDELRFARAASLTEKEAELAQLISRQVDLALATLPPEAGEIDSIKSELTQLATSEAQEQEDLAQAGFDGEEAEIGDGTAHPIEAAERTIFGLTRREAGKALLIGGGAVALLSRMGSDVNRVATQAQAAAGREVIILRAFHMPPLAIQDLDLEVMGADTPAVAEEIANDRAYQERMAQNYRRKMRQRRAEFREFIERYRKYTNFITTVISNPQFNVTALGFECSDEMLAAIIADAGENSLENLVKKMIEGGLPEAEAREIADDFYLLFHGPLGYLLAKKDSVLSRKVASGEVKLVALDNERYLQRGILLEEQYVETMVSLRFLCMERKIDGKIVNELHEFFNGCIRRRQVPIGEERKKKVEELFKDPEAQKLAYKAFEIIEEDIKYLVLRDEYMTQRAASIREGNALLIMGSSHGPWVKQRLEARLPGVRVTPIMGAVLRGISTDRARQYIQEKVGTGITRKILHKVDPEIRDALNLINMSFTDNTMRLGSLAERIVMGVGGKFRVSAGQIVAAVSQAVTDLRTKELVHFPVLVEDRSRYCLGFGMERQLAYGTEVLEQIDALPSTRDKAKVRAKFLFHEALCYRLQELFKDYELAHQISRLIAIEIFNGGVIDRHIASALNPYDGRHEALSDDLTRILRKVIDSKTGSSHEDTLADSRVGAVRAAEDRGAAEGASLPKADTDYYLAQADYIALLLSRRGITSGDIISTIRAITVAEGKYRDPSELGINTREFAVHSIITQLLGGVDAVSRIRDYLPLLEIVRIRLAAIESKKSPAAFQTAEQKIEEERRLLVAIVLAQRGYFGYAAELINNENTAIEICLGLLGCSFRDCIKLYSSRYATVENAAFFRAMLKGLFSAIRDDDMRNLYFGDNPDSVFNRLRNRRLTELDDERLALTPLMQQTAEEMKKDEERRFIVAMVLYAMEDDLMRAARLLNDPSPLDELLRRAGVGFDDLLKSYQELRSAPESLEEFRKVREELSGMIREPATKAKYFSLDAHSVVSRLKAREAHRTLSGLSLQDADSRHTTGIVGPEDFGDMVALYLEREGVSPADMAQVIRAEQAGIDVRRAGGELAAVYKLIKKAFAGMNALEALGSSRRLNLLNAVKRTLERRLDAERRLVVAMALAMRGKSGDTELAAALIDNEGWPLSTCLSELNMSFRECLTAYMHYRRTAKDRFVEIRRQLISLIPDRIVRWNYFSQRNLDSVLRRLATRERRGTYGQLNYEGHAPRQDEDLAQPGFDGEVSLRDFDTAMARMTAINDAHLAAKASIVREGSTVIIPHSLVHPQYLTDLTEDIALGDVQGKIDGNTIIIGDVIIAPDERVRELVQDPVKGPKAVVLLSEDLSKDPVFQGKACRAKSVVLENHNYTCPVFLDGGIALARSIHANNDTLIKDFYRMLTGAELTPEALDTLRREGRLIVNLPELDMPDAGDYQRLQKEAYQFLKRA